jgi:LCP family protein required for cell wall assembly
VNDQVTILILGIPGGKHDGPLLSDSIIVVNYDFQKNRVVTIGIPRDVWSSTLQDKINSAYAYGEAKKKGGGLTLAKAEVGAIVGIPIQYAAVINFGKFKNLVDFFGGIDINVKNSFVDHKFPIEGKENDECGGDTEYHCRYETIRFEKGIQHMNGETALKFSRSRNAEGQEGSDFSRSLRQQLVTGQIKGKIFQTILSFNLGKTRQMYWELNQSIERDIDNQQAASLIKSVMFGRTFKQKDFGLPRELFVVPDGSLYEGRYVLVPKDDFNHVYLYTQCLLRKEDDKQCESLINN